MVRKRLTELPEGLWAKLAELDRYVRRLDLIRGAGWTLSIAALGVGCGLLADLSFDLPLAMRIGILSTVTVTTLIAALALIWRPWRAARTDFDLAALVERAHPQLKESLVSSIELYDDEIPENERGSALMRELSAKQALQRAAGLNFRDSVSSRPALRIAGCSLLAWALLLAPLLTPSSYRLLFARFVTPWQNLDRVTSFWFDIEDGDRVVVRGSDVTLTARPRGELADLPESVSLKWIDAQGESASRRVDFDVTQRVFATTIPHVLHDFEYYLTGAGNRSRTYRVRVVEGPAITEAKVQIQPPAYTGHPAQLLDGPAGETQVLESSRLTWKVTFNKPLQTADWQWLSPSEPAASAPQAGKPVTAQGVEKKNGNSPAEDRIPFKMAADGLSATCELVAGRSGPFRLVVRDQYGLTNENDPEQQLTVLPDMAPVLNLPGTASAEAARPADVVPVDVVAIDDIGLGTLELHAEVSADRKIIIPCDPQRLIGTRIEHHFSLELSGLQLTHGDFVTYRIRATDERPTPGPNETWSEQRIIRIDLKANVPGTEQLAADQDILRQHLAQLIADVTAQKATASELQQSAANLTANEPEAQAQVQQQIEEAADQQAKLQAHLEQLQAGLGKHPLFSHLTQQTQELSDGEFSGAQRALSAAESAKDAEQAAQLKAAASELAQAEGKLEKVSRQLERLAQLERDLLELNRLAANAEHLAQRLRDLDQQQAEPVSANEPQADADQREVLQKAELQQLTQQRQELAQQAAQLLQRQPEIERAARQNLTEQLSQLTSQIADLAQPQRELAERLSSAVNQLAHDPADLAERQAELQERTSKLSEEVARQNPEPVKPIDPEQIAKVLKELQAGNLGAAANEEEQLAKQLDELEQQLREAEQQVSAREQQATDVAQRAQRLAERQAAAAELAQQAADRGAAPDTELKKKSAAELAEMKDELAKLKSDAAQEQQAAAADALQKAADRQQELAQQTQDSEAAKGEPQEPELERLLKDNAQAQKAAAESLQQLADRLQQAATMPKTPQQPEEQLAAANPDRPAQKSNSDSAQSSTKAAAQPVSEKPEKTGTEGLPSVPPSTVPSSPSERPAAESTEKPSPMPGKADTNPKEQPPAAQTEGRAGQLAAAESPARDNGPPVDSAQDTNPLAREAGELARQARQLKADLTDAQQAQELKSPLEQQQQLAEALQQLNQQLDKAQAKLQKSAGTGKGEPKSPPAPSQQAQQAMEEAARELKEGNLQKSAAASEQAAEALQQLAERSATPMPGNQSEPAPPPAGAAKQSEAAKQSASSSPTDTELPSETAAQVSEAIQQLQAALSEPVPMDGEQGSKPPAASAQPGGSQAGQVEANNGSRAGSPAKAETPGGKSSPLSPSPEGANATATATAPPETRSAAGEASAGQNRADAAPGTGDQPGAANPAADKNQAGTVTPSRPGNPPLSNQAPMGSVSAGSSPQHNGIGPPGAQRNSANPAEGLSTSNKELSSSNERGSGSPRGGPPGNPGARPDPAVAVQTGSVPADRPAAPSPDGARPAGVAAATPPSNPLQSAANRLKEAAAALRQASSRVQSQSGSSKSMANEAAEGGQPGSPDGAGEPGGQSAGIARGGRGSPPGNRKAAGVPGAEETVDVDGNLERLKKRIAGRKWGELPGKLQTEILQAAQKKPNSEYADLIRKYFKEIAQTQPAVSQPAVSQP